MRCILNSRNAVAKNLQRGMLAAIGLAAFFVSGDALRAANPTLSHTLPRGGQRGTELKVEFVGDRLGDAQEVVFHYPGISCKELKVVDPKKVEATLVIAADARLGEHHLRLRCASGMTYARNFWVSQFPNVAEVEPNDDFATPQMVAMNVTVEGEAKPEETDYYKVVAKKGQRLTVEVEGLRINSRGQAMAIDPAVAIYDKSRFELAVSDDSALLRQDPVASVIVPEDGEYTIEVRDAAFQGNGRYRAHIGTFPRPMAIFPAGGKAGSEVEFTLLGDQKGEFKQKATLPGNLNEPFEVFAAQEGALSPSGNKVRVVSYDNVLEVEPNNTVQEATPAPALPLAFNGILKEAGDSDHFKFSAKKGERFRMRALANKIGSPVDTVLYVYDAAGKAIGNSDDADGSSDSRFDFNVPADGEYVVKVRDMLDRGGSDYAYRIESEPYVPEILVSMPDMIRNDTQHLKQFDIPQGGYYAMSVNVSRQNFGGDLAFEMPKLPAGVELVQGGPIPKNLSTFPVLLKAAPNAPIAGGMYPLNVKNIDPAGPAVTGSFQQQLDFVRGEPNGTLYYSSNFSALPVSVTEAAPFSVTIDTPKVPIVRDGTLKLKVRAQRQAGYEKKITVRLLWSPPGISNPATMTFNEKDTELDYELNATANAELGKWKLTMMAESETDKGKVITATPFTEIAVEEPFVTMKMSMGNVSQGQKGELVATLEQLRPFDGQADVQIFGLPAKSESQVMKITKDQAELHFPITAADDTPVGQHKNLFCSLVIMQNGEPITHRVGMGGILRVDPKPKAPATPAPAPAAVDPKKAAVAAAPKPAKPLSRLEQLRLDAQKQAAEKK
jgi:hypothetical protein